MDFFDCPHCAEQLPIVPGRIGRQTICPSCKRPVEVPKPRRAAPGDVFGLEGDTAGHRTVAKAIERVAVDDQAEAEEDELRRPTMEWNLFLGGFGFPWTPSAVMRWGLISIWAVMAGWLAAKAWEVGVGNMYSAVAGTLTGLGAAIFGTGCVCVAAIHGLTILTETSAGNDRIETWPNLGLFLEWLGNLFYVVNAAMLCVALGFGLDWLMSGARPIVIGAVTFFLFPILLLCELEAGSAFLPVSGPVFASLWRRGLAWLLFYLETGCLLAAAGGLVVYVGAGINQPLRFGWVVLGALLFSAVVMIYFRLLGRLAYFCSVETEDEAEGSEEDTGEEAER
jgi:hypothetical protein